MADVVYVHGLFMPGAESLILRHRLAHDFDLTLHTFHHSAASSTMSAISARLEGFVRKLDVPVLHFVGHSLGGLIIYRFLEHFPDQPEGRAVFLGTPCAASRVAERASRFAPVAQLMGESVVAELLESRRREWRHARPLGIIAGSQPLGMGQFIASFNEPNDGTVAVSETRLKGAADHIVLPVSHLGLLLSARVAHQTGVFLTQGRFSLR